MTTTNPTNFSLQDISRSVQEGYTKVQDGCTEAKRRVTVFSDTYGNYLYLGAKVLALVTNPITFTVGFIAATILNSGDTNENSVSQRIAPTAQKKTCLATASLAAWFFLPFINGFAMGAATADDLIHFYRKKKTEGTPLLPTAVEDQIGAVVDLATTCSGSGNPTTTAPQ